MRIIRDANTLPELEFMKKTALMPLAIALTLATVGCAGVYMPNWSSPGTAAHQRAEAERYDPYPENQAAPPVVGARPLQYQRETPEPVKARTFPLQ